MVLVPFQENFKENSLRWRRLLTLRVPVAADEMKSEDEANKADEDRDDGEWMKRCGWEWDESEWGSRLERLGLRVRHKFFFKKKSAKRLGPAPYPGLGFFHPGPTQHYFPFFTFFPDLILFRPGTIRSELIGLTEFLFTRSGDVNCKERERENDVSYVGP